VSATLTIVYPHAPGATFDAEYYRSRHLPLVHVAWESVGLESAEAYIGAAALDGGAPPYAALTLLTFSSAETLQSALSGPQAAEVMSDISNFTTIAPVAQLSSAL